MTARSPLHVYALLVLFFISGFAALCYQLVWQRILFSTFGINIESVTIIVSLFMFGLGSGALLGARLESSRFNLLHLFMAFELTIGLFGLFSPVLIHWLSSLPGHSLWLITACVYAVFALPTLMMGATLPVLVGYINRHVAHTGASICMLYASNTLGSVVAAFMIVLALFKYTGLHAVIMLAAGLNVTIAISAFLLYRKAGNISLDVSQSTAPASTSHHYSAPFLLFLGFIIGYIALSQELVWFRIMGLVSANSPKIFGFLLGSILLGIVIASIKSRTLLTTGQNITRHMISTLILMALVWSCSFPLISYVSALDADTGKTLALFSSLGLSAFVAYLSGGIFPILCHLLQERTGESAGRAVGRLYFANVMGATLGPLLTGFLIFEYCDFRTAVLINSLITLAVITLLLAKGSSKESAGKFIPQITGVAALAVILHIYGYNGFFERLHFNQMSPPHFDTFVSNRSGFISTAEGKIFGNGAYDGMLNLDPAIHENFIERAYAVAAFHPKPRRILEIGLSGGSWAKVYSTYKPLQSFTAVEINKGYLEIVSRYPDRADILHNPKVRLIVDDGRRWLRNNPEEKFDIISSNTMIHWRSNATNVLSLEFMQLCREHLAPGGYIYLNPTGADDVAYTAAQIFPYVSIGHNGMVIAGEKPVTMTRTEAETNLRLFVDTDGHPILNTPERIGAVMSMAYPNLRDALLKRTDLKVITDDNMATEFKIARPKQHK